MHMDISQEPFGTDIYRESGRGQARGQRFVHPKLTSEVADSHRKCSVESKCTSALPLARSAYPLTQEKAPKQQKNQSNSEETEPEPKHKQKIQHLPPEREQKESPHHKMKNLTKSVQSKKKHTGSRKSKTRTGRDCFCTLD